MLSAIGLLDLLAPPSCQSCRAPGWPVLCAPCRRALPWLDGSGCPRCALPRHVGGVCPALTAPFDAAWSPLAYAGPARDLVLALKRRGALALVTTMAAQVAATAPSGWFGQAVVVPVPPARSRLRARGFDPAGTLAGAVARRTGAPLLETLVRTGAGSQAGAGRALRLARSDDGGFAARGPVPERVVLLDDVHTTGATLRACATALKAAGALEVRAAAYARAL